MGRNGSFTAQVGEIRAHRVGVGMRRIAISSPQHESRSDKPGGNQSRGGEKVVGLGRSLRLGGEERVVEREVCFQDVESEPGTTGTRVSIHTNPPKSSSEMNK